jgi:hypothetical protein
MREGKKWEKELDNNGNIERISFFENPLSCPSL